MRDFIRVIEGLLCLPSSDCCVKGIRVRGFENLSLKFWNALAPGTHHASLKPPRKLIINTTMDLGLLDTSDASEAVKITMAPSLKARPENLDFENICVVKRGFDLTWKIEGIYIGADPDVKSTYHFSAIERYQLSRIDCEDSAFEQHMMSLEYVLSIKNGPAFVISQSAGLEDVRLELQSDRSWRFECTKTVDNDWSLMGQ